VETEPEHDRSSTPPAPLLVAAAVVGLEGLGTVVFGTLEALHTTSARVVMGTTTSLFFVAFGAALVACAWGLTRVATWARGPVLISQLIALGLAWNFRAGDDTWWISVMLAVPAVVALVAMLHPATIKALNG
jgi:Mn2+/Fe2+ NRAMP family transporter